ncbi:MAG: hypothetical protein HYU71_15885 [Bacteroidetes bacterium]|nr:hypothetical protein [Bacteroidota bacterium]
MIQEQHLNKEVYTLKQVVHDGMPIVYVVHDKDGNWQFLSRGEVSESDLMIISLKQMLEIDSSIEEILWIPEGIEAIREGPSKKWTTKVFLE